MSTFGYARISTAEQNPDRQLHEMLELGIPPERVFLDKASGKDMDRPGYKELLETVQDGDCIVLDSLDRLGRNYDELVSEWKRLTREKGVDIRALDASFMDSASFRAMGDVGKVVEDMILSVLAWKAEKERTDMLRRQAAGIERAKANGVRFGRSPKSYPPELLSKAQEALDAEGKSAAARVLGCHRNTIPHLIADGRLSA